MNEAICNWTRTARTPHGQYSPLIVPLLAFYLPVMRKDEEKFIQCLGEVASSFVSLCAVYCTIGTSPGENSETIALERVIAECPRKKNLTSNADFLLYKAVVLKQPSQKPFNDYIK